MKGKTNIQAVRVRIPTLISKLMSLTIRTNTYVKVALISDHQHFLEESPASSALISNKIKGFPTECAKTVGMIVYSERNKTRYVLVWPSILKTKSDYKSSKFKK